jgi:hypothetical protein
MQTKRYRQWGERPELRPILGLRGAPDAIDAQTAAARDSVGEKWWKALREGQAGLSVKNLADSLGVLSYYLTIYGDQSDVAHAGDGHMHLGIEDNSNCGWLDLCPSPDGVGSLVNLAGLVFLGTLTGIHNRLKFGDAADKKLDGFAARLGVPSGDEIRP